MEKIKYLSPWPKVFAISFKHTCWVLFTLVINVIIYVVNVPVILIIYSVLLYSSNVQCLGLGCILDKCYQCYHILILSD